MHLFCKRFVGDVRCRGEGDAGMRLSACRARAVAGDNRITSLAGVLDQELGTQLRLCALRFISLDHPVGRAERNAFSLTGRA